MSDRQKDVLVIDEPFGHQGYFSKIERAWQRAPWGSSLHRRRVDRFDRASSLLYSPIEYEYRSFVSELPVPVPDEEWVTSNFTSFVRGEFGTGEAVRKRPVRFTPTVRNERTVGLDVFERFLETAEEELVYSSVVNDIREQAGDDIAKAVFDVLCHPLIGNRRNAQNVDGQRFRSLVEGQVTRRDRLFFVLPSFPFKDQNRFRTLSRASTVDLGEIALLVRLHVIALALYQVHPFGADVVVLSDGLLYSDIFGVDRGLALKYREQLRGFRNALNIQGTVSILDLSDVTGHVRDPLSGESVFDQTVRDLRGRISRFDEAGGQLSDSYRALVRGMKWNLSTRESLAHLSDTEAWSVLTEGTRKNLPANLLNDWESIENRSREAADRYAAVNLALRYHGLIERTFPGAIRSTVHPKADQFAVPSPGKVYPWNGVAWLNEGVMHAGAVATRPLFDLAQENSVDLFRFDLTGEPLFFARSSHDD